MFHFSWKILIIINSSVLTLVLESIFWVTSILLFACLLTTFIIFVILLKELLYCNDLHFCLNYSYYHFLIYLHVQLVCWTPHFSPNDHIMNYFPVLFFMHISEMFLYFISCLLMDEQLNLGVYYVLNVNFLSRISWKVVNVFSLGSSMRN